jgi:hypothetical protein
VPQHRFGRSYVQFISENDAGTKDTKAPESYRWIVRRNVVGNYAPGSAELLVERVWIPGLGRVFVVTENVAIRESLQRDSPKHLSDVSGQLFIQPQSSMRLCAAFRVGCYQCLGLAVCDDSAINPSFHLIARSSLRLRPRVLVRRTANHILLSLSQRCSRSVCTHCTDGARGARTSPRGLVTCSIGFLSINWCRNAQLTIAASNEWIRTMLFADKPFAASGVLRSRS